jgi:hypothetical protein
MILLPFLRGTLSLQNNILYLTVHLSDYPSLGKLHSRMICRDFFPITFENVFHTDFIIPDNKESNVYAPGGKNSLELVRNSVIGKNCLIHETAKIEMSSFGNRARIGNFVYFSHSLFFIYFRKVIDDRKLNIWGKCRCRRNVQD